MRLLSQAADDRIWIGKISILRCWAKVAQILRPEAQVEQAERVGKGGQEE
ncbi:MAG: hypothetical protein BWY17_03537 [Deltaproteobacteria bacterium ADurb.Bin207]|nr:MAG: hypothetical protein BWY17_03537 [Deltaproteobacteria bacterium ADurb.Bin207]